MQNRQEIFNEIKKTQKFRNQLNLFRFTKFPAKVNVYYTNIEEYLVKRESYPRYEKKFQFHKIYVIRSIESFKNLISTVYVPEERPIKKTAPKREKKTEIVKTEVIWIGKTLEEIPVEPIIEKIPEPKIEKIEEPIIEEPVEDLDALVLEKVAEPIIEEPVEDLDALVLEKVVEPKIEIIEVKKTVPVKKRAPKRAVKKTPKKNVKKVEPVIETVPEPEIGEWRKYINKEGEIWEEQILKVEEIPLDTEVEIIEKVEEPEIETFYFVRDGLSKITKKPDPVEEIIQEIIKKFPETNEKDIRDYLTYATETLEDVERKKRADIQNAKYVKRDCEDHRNNYFMDDRNEYVPPEGEFFRYKIIQGYGYVTVMFYEKRFSRSGRKEFDEVAKNIKLRFAKNIRDLKVGEIPKKIEQTLSIKDEKDFEECIQKIIKDVPGTIEQDVRDHVQETIDNDLKSYPNMNISKEYCFELVSNLYDRLITLRKSYNENSVKETVFEKNQFHNYKQSSAGIRIFFNQALTKKSIFERNIIFEKVDSPPEEIKKTEIPVFIPESYEEKLAMENQPKFDTKKNKVVFDFFDYKILDKPFVEATEKIIAIVSEEIVDEVFYEGIIEITKPEKVVRHQKFLLYLSRVETQKKSYSRLHKFITFIQADFAEIARETLPFFCALKNEFEVDTKIYNLFVNESAPFLCKEKSEKYNYVGQYFTNKPITEKKTMNFIYGQNVPIADMKKEELDTFYVPGTKSLKPEFSVEKKEVDRCVLKFKNSAARKADTNPKNRYWGIERLDKTRRWFLENDVRKIEKYAPLSTIHEMNKNKTRFFCDLDDKFQQLSKPDFLNLINEIKIRFGKEFVKHYALDLNEVFINPMVCISNAPYNSAHIVFRIYDSKKNPVEILTVNALHQKKFWMDFIKKNNEALKTEAFSCIDLAPYKPTSQLRIPLSPNRYGFILEPQHQEIFCVIPAEDGETKLNKRKSEFYDFFIGSSGQYFIELRDIAIKTLIPPANYTTYEKLNFKNILLNSTITCASFNEWKAAAYRIFSFYQYLPEEERFDKMKDFFCMKGFDSVKDMTENKILFDQMMKEQAGNFSLTNLKAFFKPEYKATKFTSAEINYNSFIKETDRIICLKSGANTKKSFNFINTYAPTNKILCITYRRTLASELISNAKFQGFDFGHYQQKNIDEYSSVVCQLESVWKFIDRIHEFDIVFLDESEALASQFAHAHKCNPREFNKIEMVFNYIFKKTKRVFFISANLGDETFNMINAFDQPFSFYVNEHKDKKDWTYSIIKGKNSRDEFLAVVKQYVKAGKKIIFPTNSVRFACLIQRAIQEVQIDAKILATDFPLEEPETPENGNTEKKKENIAQINSFTKNIPPEEWVKYDYVIYSPVVESGVNHVDIHFDNIMCYFVSITNSYKACYQQIFRCRNPKNKNVIICLNQGEYQSEKKSVIKEDKTEDIQNLMRMEALDYMGTDDEKINFTDSMFRKYEFGNPIMQVIYYHNFFRQHSMRHFNKLLVEELQMSGMTEIKLVVPEVKSRKLTKDQKNQLDELAQENHKKEMDELRCVENKYISSVVMKWYDVAVANEDTKNELKYKLLTVKTETIEKKKELLDMLRNCKEDIFTTVNAIFNQYEMQAQIKGCATSKMNNELASIFQFLNYTNKFNEFAVSEFIKDNYIKMLTLQKKKTEEDDNFNKQKLLDGRPEGRTRVINTFLKLFGYKLEKENKRDTFYKLKNTVEEYTKLFYFDPTHIEECLARNNYKNITELEFYEQADGEGNVEGKVISVENIEVKFEQINGF